MVLSPVKEEKRILVALASLLVLLHLQLLTQRGSQATAAVATKSFRCSERVFFEHKEYRSNQWGTDFLQRDKSI